MTKPKGLHSAVRLGDPAPPLPQVDPGWWTTLLVLVGGVLGCIPVMVPFEPSSGPFFVVLCAALLGMLGISLIAFAGAVRCGLAARSRRKYQARAARVAAARGSALWDDSIDAR